MKNASHPGLKPIRRAAKQRRFARRKGHLRDRPQAADNLIGQPGQGKRIISGAFSWTAGIIGAACVGVMRADARMKIEAARYLTWKACHYFHTTHGQGEELAIMAKV